MASFGRRTTHVAGSEYENKDILTKAIEKQSRLLADLEVIDACDIMMKDDGFSAVPQDIVGKRRLDIGMENRPRRWNHWPQLGEVRLVAPPNKQE